MSEMRAAWGEVAAEFMEALGGLSEERLEEKVEGGLHEDQTLRDQIVFFAWRDLGTPPSPSPSTLSRLDPDDSTGCAIQQRRNGR